MTVAVPLKFNGIDKNLGIGTYGINKYQVLITRAIGSVMMSPRY